MTKLRLVKNSILIVIALSLLSPKVIHFWRWDANLQALQLVSRSKLNEDKLQLHRKGSFARADECVALFNYRVTMSGCSEKPGEVIWLSPEDWQITEALRADLNRDGSTEIVLVVWRQFEPWPIDRFLPSGGRIAEFHDEAGLSAHLILVGWDGEKYRELWAGSALANPISDIRSADIDGDGFEELIALESDYDSLKNTGNITIWRWQGFGFTLLDRIKGDYSDYAIYKTDQQTLILTD